MKGKNGIHLDNKEHTILEHCLTTDKKKFTMPELSLMLLIDPDHVEEAHAHRASMHARRASSDPDSEYTVCFI